MECQQWLRGQIQTPHNVASHTTFPVIVRLFKNSAQGNFHITHSLDIYHPGGIQTRQQNATLRPELMLFSCFCCWSPFKSGSVSCEKRNKQSLGKYIFSDAHPSLTGGVCGISYVAGNSNTVPSKNIELVWIPCLILETE